MLFHGLFFDVFYEVAKLAMHDFADQSQCCCRNRQVVTNALKGLGIKSFIAQAVIGYMMLLHINGKI